MLTALLIFAVSAVSTFSTVAVADDDFESLFDGKSLDGWHIMEVPQDHKYYSTSDCFFVKDGAVHCVQADSRRGGLLLSDKQFDDFELELDFKGAWGCDSGVFLRCTAQGQAIQIMNDYLKNGCVGFVHGQSTGSFISRPIMLNREGKSVKAVDVYDGKQIDKLLYSIDAAQWNQLWKPDQWNHLKVRCVGDAPHITTWINGVKIMEMDGRTYQGRSLKDEKKQRWDAPPAWDAANVRKITGGKGHIALQIHPGERWKKGAAVQYRNMRVRETSDSDAADKVDAAPAPAPNAQPQSP